MIFPTADFTPVARSSRSFVSTALGLDALAHCLHNQPARMDHGRRENVRPATERTPVMRSRSSLFLAVFALAAAAAVAGDPAPPPTGLDGVWEITGVIDNGDAVPPARIRERLAKDARIHIRGQAISLIQPATGLRRDLLFTTDLAARPKSIDLFNTQAVGGKGIYQQDANVLVICICGPSATQRPAGFTSTPGSHNLLITLRRLPMTSESAWLPAPVPPLPPAPPPPPRNNDPELARLLVGTWWHEDDESTVLTTFNADGSYGSTRKYTKGFQRVFHPDGRTSGTWKVENGSVVSRVTASTEKQFMNQVYSVRINSISATDLIVTSPDGSAHRDVRVR